MFKILDQTFYTSGFPREKESVVEEAKSKGIINYLQTDDPVQEVLDVVNLLALDPPNAQGTRLISSFKRVTSCRRPKNECIAIFFPRLLALAYIHL